MKFTLEQLESLSAKAQEYEKGDRVALKGDDKKWYVGTVSRLGQGGARVSILFDDGDKLVIDDDEAGVKILPEGFPVKKRGMDLASLKELTDKLKEKSKAAKAKAAIKPAVKAKPVVKVPAGKDKAKSGNTGIKVSTKIKPTTPPKHSDVSTTPLEFSSYVDVTKVKTKEGMIGIIKKLWKDANAKFFDGQLKSCNITLLKDMGSKMRLLGRWSPSKRTLSISPKIRNDAKVFYEIVLHEMCHQAVTDINNYVVKTQADGHGPLWSAWMRKCGLEPKMHAGEDEVVAVMGAEEREQHERMKQKREEVGNMMQPAGYPTRGMRVCFVDSKGQVVQGVIFDVGHGRTNTSVKVLVNPISLTYYTVPSNLLFKAPRPELLGDDFDRAVTRAVEIQSKKEQRRLIKKLRGY